MLAHSGSICYYKKVAKNTYFYSEDGARQGFQRSMGYGRKTKRRQKNECYFNETVT